MLGRQCQQRVIDAVIGEDRERALRAETLRQNPGRRRAHLAQRLRIGNGAPWRFGTAALGEENRVGPLPRPLLQPVADAARAIAQRLGRAQHDAAVGAMLGNGSGCRKQARSITAWGGCHGFLLARKPGPVAASSRTALASMLATTIVGAQAGARWDGPPPFKGLVAAHPRHGLLAAPDLAAYYLRKCS